MYQKVQNEKSPDMVNPYEMIGSHGALKHVEKAIKRSVDNSDLESL